MDAADGDDGKDKHHVVSGDVLSESDLCPASRPRTWITEAWPQRWWAGGGDKHVNWIFKINDNMESFAAVMWTWGMGLSASCCSQQAQLASGLPASCHSVFKMYSEAGAQIRLRVAEKTLLLGWKPTYRVYVTASVSVVEDLFFEHKLHHGNFCYRCTLEKIPKLGTTAFPLKAINSTKYTRSFPMWTFKINRHTETLSTVVQATLFYTRFTLSS